MTRGHQGFVRTHHTPKRRSSAVPPTGQDRLLLERSTPSRREACQPRPGQQQETQQPERRTPTMTRSGENGRAVITRTEQHRLRTPDRVRATHQTPTEADRLEHGVPHVMEAVSEKETGTVSAKPGTMPSSRRRRCMPTMALAVTNTISRTATSGTNGTSTISRTEPGPCWHRDPWHTTVDYNQGEDPWMVQDGERPQRLQK